MNTAGQMFATCKAVKELFDAESCLIVVTGSKVLTENSATGFAVNKETFKHSAESICGGLEKLLEVLRKESAPMSDWIDEPWTPETVQRYIREGCFKDATQLCIFLKQSLNEWRDKAKAYEHPVAFSTVEKHQTIWINVVNGVGENGNFLRCFGAAFASADNSNKQVLLRASAFLIANYHLDTPEYLKGGEA